jgi:hypothetical protein
MCTGKIRVSKSLTLNLALYGRKCASEDQEEAAAAAADPEWIFHRFLL